MVNYMLRFLVVVFNIRVSAKGFLKFSVNISVLSECEIPREKYVNDEEQHNTFSNVVQLVVRSVAIGKQIQLTLSAPNTIISKQQ